MKTKTDFRKINVKNILKVILLLFCIVWVIYFFSPFFYYVSSSYIDSSYLVGDVFYSNDRGEKYFFVDETTVQANKNFNNEVNYFYSYVCKEGSLKISDGSLFYFLNENMIWNLEEHYFLIRY